MLSLVPGTFERRQQTPRTNNLVFTPASEARYRAWITSVSTSELTLPKIPDGLPFFAFSVSRSIISITKLWSAFGAALIFFNSGKTETPVIQLNSSALSFVRTGSHVNKPRSV